MDSINQQQPEKNHEDLEGQLAGQKMKEIYLNLRWLPSIFPCLRTKEKW